ncbi:hypothetical protein BDW02DRAFT_534015 [Decorospora gaudefroyi]|uniref:Uncharacterized protein n=1 Tax=Decorospora gaudefroyi TaxID=184978 RepID=A0A6A5K7D1_9PLEO|nr:hypothetical protein BDW02DRAFT_534015 [Decorospora gaudefroyi]
MASAWAQTQREGWLSSLYGQESGDGIRSLSNNSVQSQLINVLEGLLASTLSPKDAATKTASLIMSQKDVNTPWSNTIGMCLKAAEDFADEKELQALVDLLVELASLPDAINEGGKLWSELPEFSWNLTESFQGPELSLWNVGSPATPETAKAAWKNINTFVALLAKSRDAQAIPALAGSIRRSPLTLAMALEYSPTTRPGKNVDLHVPAAAQWFRIAGDELERLCRDGTERFHAGDLWTSSGGGDVCDLARLQFWKARMAELGYGL